MTGLLALGIVFNGVIYLMIVTVRRVKDWAGKPVSIGLILAFFSLQAAFGQAQEETTQQTNDRIQQLSQVAKPTVTDIPIGAGDVIHIDVFDVPELSRDLRVSSSGNIVSLLSTKNSRRRHHPLPTRTNDSGKAHREWAGVSSAGLCVRQRAKQSAGNDSRGRRAPDDDTVAAPHHLA